MPIVDSHAQAYPMEAETTTSSESNHYHNHKTSSDTESDQLDWDPERIDDDGFPSVDENGSTLIAVPREGPLKEDEVSSLTAWAQGYREVRKNLLDSVTGRGYYKPESSRHKKVVRKTMFEKKPPRRDRNIRTPFRDKARDHSTERITGAELRKRTRRQFGHMARECQNPAPKDIPQSSAKNFFLPGDAFAQLHDLSSYMLYDGASKTVVGCNSDLKHPEFIGLILGPARGLTDTGAQQPVVAASAALRWCDRLLKRHGLVPVDVTPSNMIATCGGIGTAKVVQVLYFPAGIVGVNGVMRFLVLEEPMSADGRQQFIPPLTPIMIMRQLGANIRMKDSGDVLEIEDDQGTTHTEKLVRERSGHVHNQLDFFSREGWKLPDSLRAQLKFDPFMASNRHEINSDATVRPVTLPEGGTVVLNSPRHVVYWHVKSGIACFQMPENPELLDDLKFESGTSSASGNLSQKRRSDCKRRLGNRPEHGKSKISRDHHHQRTSQYVENQVDPFQMKPDRRRTTKLTNTAGPMLRDVIELKQAALWPGSKNSWEAAAEGMVRQPKALRISSRSEEVRALSGTHQEHTK